MDNTPLLQPKNTQEAALRSLESGETIVVSMPINKSYATSSPVLGTILIRYLDTNGTATYSLLGTFIANG